MSEEITPARKGGRQSLGRGLGSLLGETGASSQLASASARPAAPQSAPPAQLRPEQRIWNLPIEKVLPNKAQPRRTFAAEKLNELKESILQKGVIQPIVVRPLEGGQNYEIIAGERRWRATQLAGLKEIPAILKTTDQRETLELALIENIQRADLNPIEEAEAYAQLANKYTLTQQDIAQKMGKERATIANIMRLLNLAPEVRDLVKDGSLQLGQAKVLLSVDDKSRQVSLAKKAVNQGLTVRALERLVKAAASSDDAEIAIYSEKEEITRKMLKEIENELQKKMGTKVSIHQINGKGQLSIQFYSFQELNQVIDRMRKL